MNKELIAAFDSLKDAECGHPSMVDAILSIEVGDVAEVQVVGQRPGAAIKRAISSASLSSGRSFDFVIDKENRRALIKRIDDGSANLQSQDADAIIGKIKDRIISIVSESGGMYFSAIKQRICRSTEWKTLIIHNGRKDKAFDDIIRDLTSTVVLTRSGSFLKRT